MSYEGSWLFNLNVCNNSGEDLIRTSSSIEWGYWFSGRIDGAKPKEIIKAVTDNSLVEVLSLRASSGTTTGYEKLNLLG